MNDEIIKNHVLVPKHELLDAKAKDAVLKKYGVELNQLPIILKDDPAIKTFGVKPGDVIEITRESVTSGMSIYYRVVV